MSGEFIPGEASAAPDPMIGMVLGGNYRLEKLLGSGGMGNVYRAQHVRIPKYFAVKIVKGELAKDTAAFERFKREAEIASQIGNRHIVEVVDFNTLPDGSPYMVMEYLEGEELAVRLARAGRLTLQECSHIMGQVVSALDAAHSRGIVHRDIKPENIFLCPVDGDADFVKLLDFGLSKIRGSQKRLTANLSVMGTPWYMSPEQARGDADLDHRTDIYALGVVLYQVLTGRVPFEGENIYGVLTQIATQQPPPLSQFVPDIAPGLEAAVLRALSKSPMDRPSTAGELWDEAQRGMEATWATSKHRIGPSARAQLADGTPFRIPTPSSIPVAQRPTHISNGGGQLEPRPAPPVAERDLIALDRTRPSRPGPPVEEEELTIPSWWTPMRVVAASAVVVVGVSLMGFALWPRSAPVVAPIFEVPRTAPPPLLPPASLTTSVRFELVPPTAILKLNGAVVTSPLSLTRGGPDAMVRVEAPGYRGQDLIVHPDTDRVVKVTLEPEAPPAIVPPAPTPPAVVAPTPPVAVVSPTPKPKGKAPKKKSDLITDIGDNE